MSPNDRAEELLARHVEGKLLPNPYPVTVILCTLHGRWLLIICPIRLLDGEVNVKLITSCIFVMTYEHHVNRNMRYRWIV